MDRVFAQVYVGELQHVLEMLLLSHPGHCDTRHAVEVGMLTPPRKIILCILQKQTFSGLYR